MYSFPITLCFVTDLLCLVSNACACASVCVCV